MAERITIKHPQTTAQFVMEVEKNEKLREIIKMAVENWRLQKASYWLKKADRELPLQPTLTVEKAGIREGDILEIIPDPTGG